MLDPPPRAAPWPDARPLAALASGVLLALAFPPFGVWWLAWVALAPFVWSLSSAGPRQAAARGYLLGLPFMAGVGYFTTSFGGDVLWMRLLPWVLFTLIEAVFFIPVGMLAAAVLRRGPWAAVLGVPAVWTLGEWLRGAGAMGFPFGTLASAVSGQPAVIQSARFGGAWLVSFLVAMASVGLALVLRGGGARRIGFAGLGACVATVLWGVVRLSNIAARPLETAPTATVVLAQGATRRDWGDPYALDDYAALARATEATAQHAQAKVDLVVWSESSLPGMLLQEPDIKKTAARVARSLDAPLLTGTIGYTADHRPANLAVLLGAGGAVAGAYQKRRLVPFGEWVPLRGVLPLLSAFGVGDEDEVPGDRWNVLSDGPLKLGVPICFESAIPGISRAFVRNGANLLVVITNDGWFGRSGMAAQHASISPLRAVETGRWLVRCGTTGISGFISPAGVWQSRLPLGAAGGLIGTVGLRSDTTPYVRFGDWILVVAALVVAGILIRRPA
jgi:apolipoprotein N-acyltransferase